MPPPRGAWRFRLDVARVFGITNGRDSRDIAMVETVDQTLLAKAVYLKPSRQFTRPLTVHLCGGVLAYALLFVIFGVLIPA